MAINTIISLRPQNVIRQLPWQLDSKSAVGVLSMLAALSLVCWIYLTQASAVTTVTYRIDALHLELDQLRNQNATLVLEIAQFETLSRVETRARELGFRPTTEVTYLPVKQFPMPSTTDAKPYWGSSKVQANLDKYPASDSSVWWVDWLDTVSLWVEKN